MKVIVTIVSKLGYNLLKGLITYLYRGYNPVTKYNGHPSTFMVCIGWFFASGGLQFPQNVPKPRG